MNHGITEYWPTERQVLGLYKAIGIKIENVRDGAQNRTVTNGNLSLNNEVMYGVGANL